MGNQLRRLTKFILITCIFLTSCSLVTVRERHPQSVSGKNLSPRLMWPVAKHKVTQKFHYEDSGSPHDGIDISVPKGTRIYAPADGRVVYAGQKFRGYGKMVLIRHSPRIATLYGHCHKLLVKEGDKVKKGNLIALVGNTGRASAPHLHFEVRLDRSPVNPLVYLQ